LKFEILFQELQSDSQLFVVATKFWIVPPPRHRHNKQPTTIPTLINLLTLYIPLCWRIHKTD